MKELLAKYGQKMIDATIERFNLSENEAKNLDHLEDTIILHMEKLGMRSSFAKPKKNNI